MHIFFHLATATVRPLRFTTDDLEHGLHRCSRRDYLVQTAERAQTVPANQHGPPTAAFVYLSCGFHHFASVHRGMNRQHNATLSELTGISPAAITLHSARRLGTRIDFTFPFPTFFSYFHVH